jgi:hypothetical protein
MYNKIKKNYYYLLEKKKKPLSSFQLNRILKKKKYQIIKIISTF